MLTLNSPGMLAIVAGWIFLFFGEVICRSADPAVAQTIKNSAYSWELPRVARKMILPPLASAPATDPVDTAKGRLQVGMRRDFSSPAVVDGTTVNASEWAILPDGSMMWAAEVIAEGAKGLRVHLRDVELPEGVVLLTYASGEKPELMAVGAVDEAAKDLWLPTVLADRLIFECRVPAAVDFKEVSFTLDGVSHLYDSPAPSLAKAGTCHNDVACFEAWTGAALAVGRITFVDNGNTFVCSGSLIGGAGGDYFLTANHCVPDQSVASTLEVYWLLQTSQCQGTPPTISEVPRTTGGADFVSGSRATDFALLRLRRSPPPGASALAFSAEPVATGEAVATIHHPGGGYKRISFGTKTAGDSGFTRVRWSSGVTEHGSSGAPLLNAQGQVVGQLYGGTSSCGNPSGTDSFGRFDVTFNSIRSWLEPGRAPAPPPIQLPRGNYSGLFQKPGGFSIGTAGGINLMVAANARFSGKIRMNSGLHAFSGKFDASGNAVVGVRRGRWPALSLELSVNPSDPDRISGSIGSVDWASEIFANRLVYNGTTQVAPQLGTYTLAMPIEAFGDGFARATISRAGRVATFGRMPGGTAWSSSTFVSKDGDVPIVVITAAAREMLHGWVSFGAGYWNSPSGSLNWKGREGATTQLRIIGSRYVAPRSSEPVLEAQSFSISFTGAGIQEAFIISPGTNRKISAVAGSGKISLSFGANGMISGGFQPSGFSRAVPFSGVVLQNDASGYGAFSIAGGTGSVRLTSQRY